MRQPALAVCSQSGNGVPIDRQQPLRLGWWLALYAVGLLAMAAVGDPFTPGNLIRTAWLGLGLCALQPHLVERLLAGPFVFHLSGILVLGAFLRLLLLPMAPGDDFWRYWWEGLIQWEGVNPYLLAPAAPELEGLRPPWWGRMNHPTWPAIYPPLAQLFFRFLTIAGPLTLLAFKLSFLFGDLLVVALLARWNPGAGGGDRAALSYATHPLALWAACGAAHFDIWMVAPMMATLFILLHGGGRWRMPLAAFTLGLAVAVKFIPLLAGFVWVRTFGRRAPWLALVGLCLLLPALAFGFPTVNPWATLGTFAESARFNDFFWWLLDPLLRWELGGTNDLYLKLTVVVCGLIGLGFRRDAQGALFSTLGAVLLFSPVLHPWYLTWLLPLAILARSPFWLVYAASIFLALMAYDPLGGGWFFGHLERWFVVGPPVVAWAIGRWRQERLFRQRPSSEFTV